MIRGGSGGYAAQTMWVGLRGSLPNTHFTCGVGFMFESQSELELARVAQMKIDFALGPDKTVVRFVPPRLGGSRAARMQVLGRAYGLRRGPQPERVRQDIINASWNPHHPWASFCAPIHLSRWEEISWK